MIAATRRGTAADDGLLGFSLFTYTAPEYWIGIILILLFAVALPLFPAGQQVTPGADFSGFAHVLVPATLPLRGRTLRAGAGAARCRGGAVGRLPLRALGALARARRGGGGAGMSTPLMQVADLAVHYPTRHGAARALDGVSLEWRRGEILGIVGESGCGKSTLARAMLGLVPAAAGTVATDGTEVSGGRRCGRCAATSR